MGVRLRGIIASLTMIAGLGLATTTQSLAVPVTFNFQGSFDSGPANIGTATFAGGSFAGLSASGSISGSFTFESMTPDSDASSLIGSYDGAISNFSFSVAGYSATAFAGQVLVGVSPADYSATADIVAGPAIDILGNSYDLVGYQIRIDGRSGPINDSIITDPAVFDGVFSGVSGSGFTISSVLDVFFMSPLTGLSPETGGEELSALRFTLTSIELATSVAEPGTLALLGTGLIGALGLLLRRLRQMKAVD